MAGYSQRSLLQKLGIQPGFRCLLVRPPAGFVESLGELPEGARRERRTLTGELDFIHAFFETPEALREELPRLKAALKRSGMLWISWRKGKVSPLGENAVRELALAAGLVDVKVCAVDDVWSGLKLVYRRQDR